ncbi:unnamed protein product, partial [Meganyctiphanes norvegica]
LSAISWAVNVTFTIEHENYSKIKQLLSIISLFLYVLDLVTDINTAVHHFSNGDYWWGSLTVIFIVLPLIISSAWNFEPECEVGERPVLCVFSCLCIWAKIIPLYYRVKDVTSFWGQSPGNNAKFVKICDALAGSYPQANLQMHIVFQVMRDGKAVGLWQWLSIAVSLTALAFSFSTPGLLSSDKASISSRVIFFLF